jgi:hypothetical protein
MNNPDTDNTGYTMHRTKVRENRRAIKYGQFRHKQHWVHNTHKCKLLYSVCICITSGDTINMMELDILRGFCVLRPELKSAKSPCLLRSMI